MKRLVIVLILLQFCFAAFALLPSALNPESDPTLYRKLLGKAKANLKTLPASQSKAYGKLLKRYDDILMAYLIAYESNANLAQAEPEDLFSNYQELRTLLNREGLHYTSEFFLSYVAKQTVSDERISPYRKAMLDDGLRQVWLDNANLLDRYRATASWCVEKLKFQQTSGRDQSPLDITRKSLVGRCEEMQILFVAAARTVGIPARPASTPWWAHTDNNHAWAEVFLDGKWAYTGDMDAAYHPNQTWFSGLIDKTVLILAEGSMPTSEDEILGRGSYEVLINSTRNYARERSRWIEVQVQDNDGKAVADASVSILVFNWGALRTLSTISSDQEGMIRFSSGRGAFFLSGYKDGLQGLCMVPSNDQDSLAITLHLDDSNLPDQNAILSYPANTMDWKQSPQAYQEDIATRKQLWQEQINAWASELKSTAVTDSLLLELLTQCRGNYPAALEFLQNTDPVQADFIEFLLSEDPKFLWQADTSQFEAIYNHYLATPRDADYPSQVYLPTMFYEDIPKPFKLNGKWNFYPSRLIVKESSDREKLQAVMKSLHKKHRINSRKALNGLLRLDVALSQKYLSNYQFRMLAISALRANGIAADYTRVPDNILVYLEDDWHYYDAINRRFVEQDQKNPDHALKISILDESGFPIEISEEQISLTRLVNGQFYSLNYQFEYLGKGKYQTLIQDQDLYLQFGYRISDSQTAVQILALKYRDLTQELKLIAPDYPRSWKEAEPELLAMFDAETLANASLILLGNHDQENSLRLLDRIKDMPYRFFGYAQSPAPLPEYSVLPAWQEMVQKDVANAMRSITLVKSGDKWLCYEGRWEKLPE